MILYGTPCHFLDFPMVKTPGPVIWAGSIPLSFPSWAQCFFQLGLLPYSMPSWPTWLPNSWAGTNSLTTGFMASLVLYLMRVMIKISPLIISNICAGLAFPSPFPSFGNLAFYNGHICFLQLVSTWNSCKE